MEQITRWHREISTQCGNPALQFVIAVCKMDIDSGAWHGVKALGASMGIPVFETSAKEGTGRIELIEAIVFAAKRGPLAVLGRRACRRAFLYVSSSHRKSRTCFGGVLMPRDVCKMILQLVRESQYDEAWERAIPEAERLEFDLEWIHPPVVEEEGAASGWSWCTVL